MTVLAIGVLAIGVLAASGCGGSSVPPVASTAPSPDSSLSLAPTAAPTATVASTVPSTGTSLVDAVVTTPTSLGDLLTEAEVVEIEQALDELDLLLGEIDADLADLADP